MLAVERCLRDLFEYARRGHLRGGAVRLARRLVDEQRGEFPLEVDPRISSKQSGHDRRLNLGEPVVARDVGAGRLPRAI